MKIAIIGTHGIGKTTLAYEIATEAKRRGKNAIVINEVARRCPFPLNDGFTTDGAEWIVTSQINRELQAKSEKYEYIVCDRSAYDPICYLKAGNRPQENFNKLEAYAEEWLKTYDFIYFILPTGKEPVADGVRSIDPDFQENVHREFLMFWIEFKQKKITTFPAEKVFKNDFEDIYKEVFK